MAVIAATLHSMSKLLEWMAIDRRGVITSMTRRIQPRCMKCRRQLKYTPGFSDKSLGERAAYAAPQPAANQTQVHSSP